VAYIGNQPTIGQYRKLDDISGSFNGSLTAFTMQVGSTNVSAGSVFQLLISLGGVIQNPGTDFTVSGSTLTFTTAPTSGLDFFGILMGQPLNTATPGDSTVTGAKIVDGTITGSKLAAGFNYDSGLLFLDDTNNRVGVSTASPERNLSVGNGTNDVIVNLKSGTANFCLLDFGDSDNNAMGRIGYFNDQNAMTFRTNGSGEDMRINSAGQLLIGTAASRGTATPAMLQIAGGNGSTTFTKVAIISGNDEDAGGLILDSSAANSIGLQIDPDDLRSDSVFRITVDGTERMRIVNGVFKATRDGSYNSATGTDHELNNNVTSAWGLRIRHTASSDPRGILLQYTGAAPNNTTAEFIQAQDSSALRMTLRSNGGIANFQSNDANLCDEREKKNIEALDSTWGCLKNWELKKFHYNEDADTDDKRYGVIAQQVAEHCPEVITDWVKQKAEDAVLDEDGNVVTPAVEEIVRMGVKEQQMYWMAIKALQEAQTRIETLEAEVAALKGA